MKDVRLLPKINNNNLPALISDDISAERVPDQFTHVRKKHQDKSLFESTKKSGSHTLSSLHFFQNQF
jgi:hypothetical protein